MVSFHEMAKGIELFYANPGLKDGGPPKNYTQHWK